MRKVRVKICGITNEKDLAVAVAAGADAVGFVVGVDSSPRNLALEKAQKLIRIAPIFVDTVAVTTSNSIDSLVETYETLRPNALQVYGEIQTDAAGIREKIRDARLIKAVHVKAEESVKEALESSDSFDAILLDSFVQGKQGGTGNVHNWQLSRQIRQMIEPKPLILAGGLAPENVQDAVREVQPYSVDVSSGVESCPGVKDHEKVLEFIKKAKEVDL